MLVDATPLHTRTRLRGIGRYVTSLCAALHATPTSLRIAALRGLGPGGAAPLDAPAVWDEVPEWRHRWVRRLRLRQAARRARLVHLADPAGTPWGIGARVVTCHDLIPLRLPEYRRGGPLGWALQRARDHWRFLAPRRVLAISEATRADLIELLGLPGDRIDVTPLGVDHARFHPRAPEGERAAVADRLGFDDPYLLYVGAADPRKNLPTLVRAFARSRASRHHRLVIVGALQSARGRALQELVVELGAVGRVVFTGFVEEALVPGLYRHATLHVFPSTYEGFGLPVVEAMACGAPTLGYRVSSIGEVGGDALIEPEAAGPEALGATIERALDDDDLRADARRRGLARAAHFTWARCAEATLGAYERALR